MEVTLRPLAFAEPEGPVSVKAPKFVVGRAEDCHLRLASPLVSRHHCVLTVEREGARIRDLSSRNGTFVNGRRVDRERSLEDGDLICVAASLFEVELHRGARPAGRAVGNIHNNLGGRS